MNDEMITDTTLRDYLRVLFRHKAVMLVTVLTVCATVFVGLKFKTKVYESRVKMLITAEKMVESPYYRELYGSNKTQQTLTQSEIVKSGPVLGRAVRALALNQRPLDDEKQFSSPLKAKWIAYQAAGLAKKLEKLPIEQQDAFLYRRAVESLRSSVNVEPIRDTNMFTISVRDYNPVGAAVIANVVSRSYVIFDLEQQLAELKLKYGDKHPTVTLLEDSISKMKDTMSGDPMDDIEAIGPASVKIIEQASVALEPSGTSKTLTMLLAVIMSLFLAVMLAFIFEYSDQTLKTPRDIQAILGLPLLGSIARKRLFNRTLIDFDKRLSAYGRSYQAVSDQLHLLIKDKGLKTLLVTATLKEENNAVVIANLAKYMSSKLRHKVLIIDADLRAPSMDRLFKVAEAPGLVDYLDGPAALGDITRVLTDNLSLIPAGETVVNPVILLDSPRMKDLLNEARDKYQIVFIRGPQVKGQKDTAILSTLVDGSVLVVDEGKVRRQVIKDAVNNMSGRLENPLGVILNQRTYPIPKFVYDNV